MANLQVATFNIRHGRGLDGRVDLSRTAGAIAQTEAEIVALQELDRGHERSDRVDQPAALAEMTGLEMYFFPTIEDRGYEYGIAIGSKEPLATRFVELPERTNDEPRGAIVSQKEGITIIATHLSIQRRARSLQVRALADLVRDAGEPVLLLGDLNTGSRGLRSLREAGLSAGPRVRSTMAKGIKRIDWIMATPPLRVVETHATATEASDHLPVDATVERPL
jgi:endonuclease/exonuclease/phosphatase family metal-dependent hydrolase